jgi:hypothetical protein
MKYKIELDIALPRKRVVELFDNPENLKKWQKGLISFETVSGTAGEEGAKSLLKYKMGKREVEMTETIVKRNIPDEFSGIYEAKNVWNEVKNYFKEEGTDNTLWELETEFRFKGFMKVMATIMPGAFKKQSLKSMNDFKEFAEKEGK